VTPFDFSRELWQEKTRLPGLSSVEHRLVTDRQKYMTMAYTALAWRRVTKFAVLAWQNLTQS